VNPAVGPSERSVVDSRCEEPDGFSFPMDLSSGKEDIVIAYLVLEEECAQKQWGRGLIPGHVVRDGKG
jgi:hypothetical protein